MIVCKQCGHQNEDNDTFCGSCGKFLEWTGERVVVAQPEPEPEPEPEPVAEPARVGFIDRVKQAVGIEEAPPQPAGAAEPALTPVSVTSAAPAGAPVAAAPAAAPMAAAPMAPAPMAPTPVAPYSTAAAPMTAAPFAATPAPAAAPAPIAPQPVRAAYAPPPVAPVAVQPDEPMSRRPTSVAPAVARPRPVRTVEAPTRRHPGDLICGQCGEGNDPSRHFCRRCGSSLDEAIAVRLPWYRRFFSRVFGIRTREAGWRPHRVGRPNVMGLVWRIIRLAIVAIILVGVLAFLLIPAFHTLVVDRVTTAVTAVRKIVHPNYDPIHPIGASASTSIAGHSPTLAMDNATNTYWAAAASDHNPTLVLRFQVPVDLAEIGFTSGASGTAPADQFLTQPRPHAVHLVFSDGTSQDLNISDSEKAQFFPISAKQVTFVEIHVQSFWATAGASPSSVAITEVEFRIKD